jgi:prepilin signal peptidase PulO-like enzyme (type II secretory pathway)
MVIAIIILAWLGLAFGSFVNALVWRVHEQSKHQHKKTKSKKKENLSIINGRSVCPDCRHTLAWHDLIPGYCLERAVGTARNQSHGSIPLWSLWEQLFLRAHTSFGPEA